MSKLSEWLEIMLDEIARKRDAEVRAQAEDAQRNQETTPSAPRSSRSDAAQKQRA